MKRPSIALASLFIFSLAACTVEPQAPEIKVESIAIDQEDMTLTEGESVTLTAMVLPENAVDKTIKWSSSNDEVVMIASNGKAKALVVGSAIISAAAGDKTDFITITVISKTPLTPGGQEIKVESITIDQEDLTLIEGESATLTATILPENATNKTVTWTSSNDDVVMIASNGKAKALASGSAVITATAGEKTDFITINVVAKTIPVTGISLIPSSITMKVGESQTIVPEITPSDATDKSVTWSCSNTEVASVENGTVVGLKPGSATITAYTNDGGKTAECAVTIKSNLAPSVTIGSEKVSAVSVFLQGKANLESSASSDLKVGFQYSTSSGILPSNSITVEAIDADSEYNYSIGISGLEPNTTYYYRAFLRQNGQDYYGETQSFTTKELSSLLETMGVSDVKYKEATLNAKLDLLDVIYKDISFGFYWDISEDNLMNIVESDGLANNAFYANLKGIFAGTTFWYKAFVAFDGKLYFGEKQSSATPIPEGAVELGLSVLWAECNLGANAPEEYGDYYAWGETETKSNYDWSTYKFGTSSSGPFSKYNTISSYGTVDNKTVLDPEDDVAHVVLGGSWRMPTDAEWTELRTKCTWTWTTENGVNGRRVTGPNGNSIFLPAAGYWDGANLYNAGPIGYYWSSSLRTNFSHYVWHVRFDSDGVYRYDYYRYSGLSVRPVSE